jgi:hypothetical protein
LKSVTIKENKNAELKMGGKRNVKCRMQNAEYQKKKEM